MKTKEICSRQNKVNLSLTFTQKLGYLTHQATIVLKWSIIKSFHFHLVTPQSWVVQSGVKITQG